METGIGDDYDVVLDSKIILTSRQKIHFPLRSGWRFSSKVDVSYFVERIWGWQSWLFCLWIFCARMLLLWIWNLINVMLWDNRREAVLFTLHHGAVLILVTDLWRNLCQQLNLYGGLHDGIFPLDENHAFMRELIDTWIGKFVVLEARSGTYSHNGHKSNGLQALHTIVLEVSRCTTENVPMTF